MGACLTFSEQLLQNLKIAPHLYSYAIGLKKPQRVDSCLADCFQEQHSRSEDKNQEGVVHFFFFPSSPPSEAGKKITMLQLFIMAKNFQARKISWLHLITNKQVNNQLYFNFPQCTRKKNAELVKIFYTEYYSIFHQNLDHVQDNAHSCFEIL